MAYLSINFKSESLKMPVMLDILIPQGRGNYKTLYLLHGAGGDRKSWVLNSRVADYAQSNNIAIIMPSGNNRCYVDNVHGKDYYTFITEELINKCETWFSLSNKREDRFIAGMSMGGYGAVYAALMSKELYSAAFSYSGLLDVLERYDNPQGISLYPVFGDRKNLLDDRFNINNYVLNNTDNVDNDTKFIITCGEQDQRIHMSKNFYDNALSKKYKTVYISQPGGHDWEYWDICIKNTLKLIGSINNKSYVNDKLGENVDMYDRFQDWSRQWQSLT